jgi:hypothetical protein
MQRARKTKRSPPVIKCKWNPQINHIMSARTNTELIPIKIPL